MRGLGIGAAFGLALLCTIGCKGTHERFVPYSASQLGDKVAKRAVQFYEGDVATIMALNPRFMGTVFVTGNGRADFDDCESNAAGTIADAGGTHFVMMTESIEHQFATLPGFSSSYTTVQATGTAYRAGNVVSGSATGSAQTTGTYMPPRTVAVETPQASYRALRVEPERWSELPEPLRPKPDSRFWHNLFGGD